MKRLLSIFLMLLLFAGCSENNKEDKALQLRRDMLSGNGCSFDAVITADYGETIHVFSMRCSTDSNDVLTFAVTSPETISGISGKISDNGGQILFDDVVLAFPLMAEGQVSPVSSPWLFMKTLKGGYLSGYSDVDKGYMLRIYDSYEEESLVADILIGDNDLPEHCEIQWQGRRILSLDIRNFTYL